MKRCANSLILRVGVVFGLTCICKYLSATELEDYYPLVEAKERFATKADPNSRILGGRPVNYEDAPWQVALLNGSDPDNRRAQFCGGTLMNEKWVVTAAHCVDTANIPGEIHVLSGTDKLSTGGVRVAAGKIIIHPNWNRKTRDSDIALIRLSTKISGEASTRIAIDSGVNVAVNSLIHVTGWGVNSNRQLGTDQLQGVDLPMVHFLTCRRPQSYGDRITPTMFCAGKKDADACRGDSGGPASIAVASSRILIGISSWGYKCGLPNKFGVFTKVSAFKNWIEKYIGLE